MLYSIHNVDIHCHVEFVTITLNESKIINAINVFNSSLYFHARFIIRFYLSVYQYFVNHICRMKHNAYIQLRFVSLSILLRHFVIISSSSACRHDFILLYYYSSSHCKCNLRWLWSGSFIYTFSYINLEFPRCGVGTRLTSIFQF